MPERPITIQDIEWRDLFMFTRIFRAFRIAIRPSKILLALAALLCVYAGGRTLDLMWPQKFIDRGHELRSGIPAVAGDVIPPFASFLRVQLTNFSAITSNAMAMDWSYPGGVPDAMARFVLVTPVQYWQANKVYFTLWFAWFLTVWAFFGGAIARISAVHVTRDEVISPWRAIRFSARAFPSFLAAPLIPFILVMILGMMISLLGLLLYIPYLGPIATGLLLVVPILLGIVMMLLVVGSVAGCGLMYPTIAVEGSDAFDAVSRTLSHVFSAPWRLLFYVAVATLYGAVTYFFVRICVFVLLWLVHFFIGWFLVGNADSTWQTMWPVPRLDELTYSPDWSAMNWGGRLGAGVASFWVYLTIATLGAFVVSFFFSASTIIYVLMRRKVDAAELDAVYLEPLEEEPPQSAEEPGKDASAASPASATPDARQTPLAGETNPPANP